MKNRGIQTIAIHGGEKPDSETGASAPNIVMSSTFVVDEPISFSANNIDDDSPYVYTRWSNPTIRQLEEKLARLENAEDCLAVASGMAASTGVLLTQLHPGDHLILSNTNYPGTAELARDHLPARGVEVTPVDTSDLASVRNAVRPNTRMIWVETPSNPLLRITDITAVAQIARSNEALLVVDSTFATPVSTRPIDLGADLVVHSLTKYIGGHGDALGGAILGGKSLISSLRADGVLHYGATISPFNAWLIMRGAATLPLRMQAHQENAMQVADYLHAHPRVENVLYPGHPSHPAHELARAQMSNFSGMLSFRTRNPHKTAKAFMQGLQVVHYAVSLGHHRSLVYLMETRDLIDSSYRLEGRDLAAYRALAGDGLFRFSVGLEDAADIINDLDRVL